MSLASMTRRRFRGHHRPARDQAPVSETRSLLRALLGPEWLIEGPVDVPFHNNIRVARARRVDVAAASNELRGLTAMAPTDDEALNKLLKSVREHRPAGGSPAKPKYEAWVAEQLDRRLSSDPVDYADPQLRVAWENAAALLPPGWRIDEVTTYFEDIGPGRWSAHVSAPYLYIRSDHDFVGRAAYGDDPVSALRSLAVVLPTLDVRETL